MGEKKEEENKDQGLGVQCFGLFGFDQLTIVVNIKLNLEYDQ